MNVLLGRNGFGKSHFLRGIVAGLQWDEEHVREFSQSGTGSPTIRIDLTRDNKEVSIVCEDGIVRESCGKIPLLAIPDSRFMDRSRTTLTVISDERGDLKGDGAYHFLYQKPYDAPLCSFLYDLCGEYLRKRKGFQPPVFQLVRTVVQQLTDSNFEFAGVEDLEQGRYRLLIYTEGNEKRPLPIQVASQGTLSVIAVFGQIFAFLRSVFPTVRESELFSQPAIVFIDEIDAHLHPVWQQKILHLLRNNFPAVQFVVTAHSPLVVAGCRDGEVAVLQRTDERRFKVQPIEHDFVGWGPEEIYREVFGIEEKDKAFDYYTSLEPQRSQLEEEHARLKSMPTLNRKDEERFRKISDDLYYLDKAREKRTQGLVVEELKRENARLRFKLEKLEKGLDEHESTADE
jgi:ABC-type cobalamin/Fe3+-siderophores transport system ATPase subunit